MVYVGAVDYEKREWELKKKIAQNNLTNKQIIQEADKLNLGRVADGSYAKGFLKTAPEMYRKQTEKLLRNEYYNNLLHGRRGYSHGSIAGSGGGVEARQMESIGNSIQVRRNNDRKAQEIARQIKPQKDKIEKELLEIKDSKRLKELTAEYNKLSQYLSDVEKDSSFMAEIEKIKKDYDIKSDNISNIVKEANRKIKEEYENNQGLTKGKISKISNPILGKGIYKDDSITPITKSQEKNELIEIPEHLKVGNQIKEKLSEDTNQIARSKKTIDFTGIPEHLKVGNQIKEILKDDKIDVKKLNKRRYKAMGEQNIEKIRNIQKDFINYSKSENVMKIKGQVGEHLKTFAIAMAEGDISNRTEKKLMEMAREESRKINDYESIKIPEYGSQKEVKRLQEKRLELMRKSDEDAYKILERLRKEKYNEVYNEIKSNYGKLTDRIQTPFLGIISSKLTKEVSEMDNKEFKKRALTGNLNTITLPFAKAMPITTGLIHVSQIGDNVNIPIITEISNNLDEYLEKGKEGFIRNKVDKINNEINKEGYNKDVIPMIQSDLYEESIKELQKAKEKYDQKELSQQEHAEFKEWEKDYNEKYAEIVKLRPRIIEYGELVNDLDNYNEEILKQGFWESAWNSARYNLLKLGQWITPNDLKEISDRVLIFKGLKVALPKVMKFAKWFRTKSPKWAMGIEAGLDGLDLYTGIDQYRKGNRDEAYANMFLGTVGGIASATDILTTKQGSKFFHDVNPQLRGGTPKDYWFSRDKPWRIDKYLHEKTWSEPSMFTIDNYKTLLKLDDTLKEMRSFGKMEKGWINSIRLEGQTQNIDKRLVDTVIDLNKRREIGTMFAGSSISKDDYSKRIVKKLLDDGQITDKLYTELTSKKDFDLISMNKLNNRYEQVYMGKEYLELSPEQRAVVRKLIGKKELLKSIKKNKIPDYSKLEIDDDIVKLREEYEKIFEILKNENQLHPNLDVKLKGSLFRANSIKKMMKDNPDIFTPKDWDNYYEAIKPKIQEVGGRKIVTFKDIDTQIIGHKHAKEITEQVAKAIKGDIVSYRISVGKPRFNIEKTNKLITNKIDTIQERIAGSIKAKFGRGDTVISINPSDRKTFKLNRATSKEISEFNEMMGLKPSDENYIDPYAFDAGTMTKLEGIKDKIKYGEGIEITYKGKKIGKAQSLLKDLEDTYDVENFGKMVKHTPFEEAMIKKGGVIPHRTSVRYLEDTEKMAGRTFLETSKKLSPEEMADFYPQNPKGSFGMTNLGEQAQFLDEGYDLFSDKYNPMKKIHRGTKMDVENMYASLTKEFMRTLSDPNPKNVIKSKMRLNRMIQKLQNMKLDEIQKSKVDLLQKNVGDFDNFRKHNLKNKFMNVMSGKFADRINILDKSSPYYKDTRIFKNVDEITNGLMKQDNVNLRKQLKDHLMVSKKEYNQIINKADKLKGNAKRKYIKSLLKKQKGQYDDIIEGYAKEAKRTKGYEYYRQGKYAKYPYYRGTYPNYGSYPYDAYPQGVYPEYPYKQVYPEYPYKQVYPEYPVVSYPYYSYTRYPTYPTTTYTPTVYPTTTTPTVTSVTPTITPTTPLLPILPPNKKHLTNGYLVVSRDFVDGKPVDKAISIGKTPQDAVGMGQQYVDENPDTSFSIIPTHQRGNPYKGNPRPEKFIKKHGRWYEKNNYRFDSTRERGSGGMMQRKRQRSF